MSGQATGWVLLNGPRPDDIDRAGKAYGARARGLRSIMVAVADAANIHGEHAHPGVDNVASAALYSRRQTLNLLGELEAEGWLQCTERGGGNGHATVYRVVCDRRPGVQPLHPPKVQPDGGTVQPDAAIVHPRVHPNGVTTEPTNEPKDSRASVVSMFDPDADNPEGEAFERFWAAYPRGHGKGAARKAWPKAVRVAGDAELIIAGASRFAADPNRDDAYTPHASTWLNAERWNDPPLPPRQRRGGGPTRRPDAPRRTGTAEVDRW